MERTKLSRVLVKMNRFLILLTNFGRIKCKERVAGYTT